MRRWHDADRPATAAPPAPTRRPSCCSTRRSSARGRSTRERLTAFAEKATRRRRLHTSWTDPDARLRRRGARLRRRARSATTALVAAVEAFLREHRSSSAAGSTRWPRRRCCSPARACPTSTRAPRCWDLSLVDPDNRRPVDFDHRRRLLARGRARAADGTGARRRRRAEAVADRARAGRPPPPARRLRRRRRTSPSPPRGAEGAPRGRLRSPRHGRRGAPARDRPRRRLGRHHASSSRPARGTTCSRAPITGGGPVDGGRPAGRVPGRRAGARPADVAVLGVGARRRGGRRGGRRPARRDERRRAGLVGAAVDGRAARQPLRLLASTAARRGPTHARCRSPTASHGLSAVVDHDAFDWHDARLARRRPARRRALRAARRHVHGGGHLRRRHRAPRPSRRPRRRRRRADAGRRVLRPPRLGLRRRRPLRARTTPTAARTASSASSTPATASGSAWSSTSSTTTSARRATTSASSGRTSPTATTPAGARRSTSTVRAATRCAASSSTTRCMWLRDYHVDGLRLDAVHAIVDTSALHVLEELAVEVDALAAPRRQAAVPHRRERPQRPGARAAARRRRVGLARRGPTSGTTPSTPCSPARHDGYYADFGTLPILAKALRQAWVHDGAYSPVPRPGPRPAARPASPVDRFVVATQNHDQVGNRAAGRAPRRALTTEGRLKVAAALLLTSPFVPMLFQGEEWAASTPFQYFTDHDDPELGRAVTEGRRREFAAFGWDPEGVPDPQDPRTFERSKLRWAERHDGVPRPRAGLVPPAPRAAAAHAGAHRPDHRADRRWTPTRPPGWSWCGGATPSPWWPIWAPVAQSLARRPARAGAGLRPRCTRRPRHVVQLPVDTVAIFTDEPLGDTATHGAAPNLAWPGLSPRRHLRRRGDQLQRLQRSRRAGRAVPVRRRRHRGATSTSRR